MVLLPSGNIYLDRNPYAKSQNQFRAILRNVVGDHITRANVILREGSFEEAHAMLDAFFEAGFCDVRITLVSAEELEALTPSGPIELP